MVVFFHVPKVGGTTLVNVLARQYKPNFLKTNINTSRHLDNPEYDCLCGHFEYRDYGEVDSIVVLRNPVERLWSLFWYMKSKKNHGLHHDVVDMSFVDFVRSNVCSDVDNGITRILSGRNDICSSKSNSPVEKIDYVKAYNNLKKIRFVGVTENLDSLIFSLGKHLNWVNFTGYTNYLVNNDKPRMRDRSSIDAVMERNGYDFSLYVKAVELQGELNAVSV